jgi:hypothetical protein
MADMLLTFDRRAGDRPAREHAWRDCWHLRESHDSPVFDERTINTGMHSWGAT